MLRKIIKAFLLVCMAVQWIGIGMASASCILYVMDPHNATVATFDLCIKPNLYYGEQWCYNPSDFYPEGIMYVGGINCAPDLFCHFCTGGVRIYVDYYDVNGNKLGQYKVMPSDYITCNEVNWMVKIPVIDPQGYYSPHMIIYDEVYYIPAFHVFLDVFGLLMPECKEPPTPPPPGTICGNGICETGEDCSNCSHDCGSCGCCSTAASALSLNEGVKEMLWKFGAKVVLKGNLPKELEDGFFKHSDEIAMKLIQREEFRIQARGFIQRYLPFIEAVAEGKYPPGEMNRVFTPGDAKTMRIFIEEFAQDVSPELQEFLRTMVLPYLDTLAGSNFGDLARLLGGVL